MRMNSTYRSSKQSPVAPLLRTLYKRRVLVMLFLSCMLGMAALHVYQRHSVPSDTRSEQEASSAKASSATQEPPAATTASDVLKQHIEHIQHDPKLSAKERADAIRDALERASAGMRDADHAHERDAAEHRRRLEDFMQKIGKKAGDVERDGLGKLDGDTLERLMEQRRKLESFWKDKEIRGGGRQRFDHPQQGDDVHKMREGSLQRLGENFPQVHAKRDSDVEAASWNHFADDKTHNAMVQREQQDALHRIREEVEQRRRARMDELRNTAFGVVPLDPKEGDAKSVVDRDGGGGATKDPSLRMTFMTTLKSCVNESTRFAQLDAVMSWVSLPVHPAPNVYLLGTDPCAEWVAEHVNLKQRQVFGGAASDVVHVIPDVKVGPHGTVLLGPAIHRVAMETPNADVFGFINADILLDPITAVALYKVALRYSEFFMIAHRASVSIPLSHRASYSERKPEPHDAHQDGDRGGAAKQEAAYAIDVTLPGWSKLPPFQTAQQDRQDAEDFFFWSNGFFTKKGVDPSDDPFSIRQRGVPPFHVGRPAYDNWLVHHAIHTWKPVIDGSEMVVAYHQRHDYQHLPEQDAKNGRSEQKSYWGGVEQKENYDLGVANGGWQHGLIEFAPLGFTPRGCAGNLKREADEQLRHFPGGKSEMEFARNKGRMMFDWYASAAQKEVALSGQREGSGRRRDGSCTVAIRSKEGWRPFPDNSPFQDEDEYAAHYARYEK